MMWQNILPHSQNILLHHIEYEKNEVSMGFKEWMKVCEDKINTTHVITLNYVIPLCAHTHTGMYHSISSIKENLIHFKI
jgi:hypothetical protein